MSWSALIPFRADGTHGEYVEFRNAWGLHARVWDVLQRHLGWEGAGWLTALGYPEKAKRFWGLYKDPAVPDDERVALAATFDRVWIPAEHVPRVAAAFRAMTENHPPGNRVCHLRVAADAMEEAVTGGAIGVGFHGTSVSENPWVGYPPDPEWEDDDERWDDWDPDPVYLGPESPDSARIDEVLPDIFGATP